MEHMAQLQLYSYGKVTNNPELGESEIMVMPTETKLFTDADIVHQNNTTKKEINTRGGKDNISVDETNSIPCRWLKYNSNRQTPPNVRRNDDVLIYRLGNSSKFFWVDISEANVKRLETVLYAFSADPVNPINDDFTNCYFFEVSAHGKTITLHTSQANGEAFGYDIQLNTDDSRLTVLDTALNEIFLDSAKTTIGVINANKTRILLAKKNINMFAPNNISVEATNLIAFKCKDFKIDASNTYSLNTKTITINSTSYTSTSKSNTFNCPKSVFSGDLAAANISVGGGAKGPGTCIVDGMLQAQNVTCEVLAAKAGHIEKFTHGGGKCC